MVDGGVTHLQEVPPIVIDHIDHGPEEVIRIIDGDALQNALEGKGQLEDGAVGVTSHEGIEEVLDVGAQVELAFVGSAVANVTMASVLDDDGHHTLFELGFQAMWLEVAECVNRHLLLAGLIYSRISS